MTNSIDVGAVQATDASPQTPVSAMARMFSWSVTALTLMFALNNYLIFWLGWPGALPAMTGKEAGLLTWVQLASYLLCILGPAYYTLRTPNRTLRGESQAIAGIAAFIIRASFWAVIFVGLADMVISFLRVEGLLPAIVGNDLATALGRSQFRGANVHIPLVILGVIVACFSRSVGFTWLALLVVVAELSIVLSRFVFSYEQAFQGDLVRFWYGALFLFASAYTLYEDGHVRVDVVYASLTRRLKGLVNIWGSFLLGMSLCATVLLIGMWGKSSIINSPLLSFEVSQSGFGMYVKYLMAGFLGIFAISMMIQFASYILESLADYREEPGHRTLGGDAAH